MSRSTTRTGVVATKLGMTRVFGEGGKHIPVTVLKLVINKVAKN